MASADKDKDNSVADSSSNKKKDTDIIINTDILGLPLKVDTTTLAIGAIAALALGVGGYSLYNNYVKEQEAVIAEQKKKELRDQQYMAYVKKQQEMQEQQKNELLAREQAIHQAEAERERYSSGHADRRDRPVSYDEMLYGEDVSSTFPNTQGPELNLDYEPYHKSSRLQGNNIQAGTVRRVNLFDDNRSSRNEEYQAPLPPPPNEDGPPGRFRGYTPQDEIPLTGGGGGDNNEYQHPQPLQHHRIKPVAPNEDLLPVQFSPPMTSGNPSSPPPGSPGGYHQPFPIPVTPLHSQQQYPQQNNRRPQRQQQQQQQDQEDNDGSNGEQQELSADALMASVNNSSLY